MLADFTQPNTSVTRRKLVGGVDFGVTVGAEKRGVSPAEEGGGGGFAGVT